MEIHEERYVSRERDSKIHATRFVQSCIEGFGLEEGESIHFISSNTVKGEGGFTLEARVHVGRVDE